MSETVKSPRERYRAQVRDEIKAHAWAQVATTGAAALSLNAIAKQMGISGPALYRYFRNRDELMTELVLDAYRDLSTTCRAAAATAHTPTTRLAAVAGALRRWALAEPHRYLLIYGTPVPGYAAPPEATAIAASIMSVLMDAFTAASAAADTASDAATGPLPKPAAALDRHLATHRQWAADHPAPPAVLRCALTFWTRLHGVVSLEVAGHFTGMNFDPALLYAAEADAAIAAR
ncbi:TetR/AcrR family transcriptional regulator [Rugosimonospora africana]|uniref:TetR family transcriptional regulator n=1 Tax=Rugosimonospora africana TaxID=556532 RepID=A0A8J3VV12_9ACTN|nr:TetR/AcrR family transcriptional regulator [Rugosimonospora africana]GIH19795.1 TetR family transcriptional regulator [Rugosimonospora africana]